MKTRSAILAAALGAAMLSAPALAESKSVGINYADLNLATPYGQQELDHRIDAVARQICGMDDLKTGTMMPSAERRQCYQQAKQSARKQVAERLAHDEQRGG